MSEYSFSDAQLHCSSDYLLPIIKKRVERLPKRSVIVDVGCGNGSLLAQLQEYGHDLHGIEVSSSGLTHAKNAFPNISFYSGDLTSDMSSHPLAGKCDVVISTEVIEHVFLPRVFASNCHSLLKSKGTLIVSTPYHGYLKNLSLALAGKMESHFTVLWDYGHIKFWSRASLTRLLTEAGFSVREFVGAGRIPYLWKSMVLVADKGRDAS
jgi:2-polyprenyl-6-hydroxyphenyl methylase/3-demethylubiquinone-9 3-methyltransferase